MNRKTISKKTRFEVFKRDSFTCQYCGNSAPNVLLEVDHIKPVSKDGDNDITNLITSCWDCNRGKAARELSDDAVVLKRKKQLDELQSRREQIEMMMQWRGELDQIQEQEINSLVEYVNSKIDGFYINDNGIKPLKLPLKKYGLAEMLESVSVSAEQYLEYDKDGNQIESSIDKYLSFIPKIAASRKRMAEKPYLRDLYYVRGIMRKRFSYVGYETMKLLEEAYLSGVCIEELKELAIDCRNWKEWVSRMEEYKNE